MKYTQFGEYFRILRIKHQEVLFDATKYLKVTSAYISSVECGKRSVPEEWEMIICNHFKLNDKEKMELHEAIEQSKTLVKISLENASPIQKQAALSFCRSFDDIDEETAKKIVEILERNNNGL